MSDTYISDAIAIIGMSCRFPGAADKETFWKNLQNGTDVLTTFSDEELLENGVTQETLDNPNYVHNGYPIDDIEMFDASLFGYSPAEAKRIDPQQRIFLQCAWSALEDAGYSPDSRLHTGVFASAKMSTYQDALSDPNTIGTSAAFTSVLGNDKDYIATRTSFKLGLTGPSFTVQTACSSSLAATHLAIESLLSGECDMALAGGASISVPQRIGYTYEEGMICSPDAKCRAFDKDASGICASNGVGVVLLKPFEKAVEDGDTIYAVIRGSAMNNDGAQKAGFTAPSINGQYNVIRDALSVANESADNISYVEAHGTGTLLGDPIEIQALTKAYRKDTDASGYCAIGSVKSNVGHLDTAAGVCSLIKTALALHHKHIPATLHFSTPNPHIPFATTPFAPIATSSPWKKRNNVRMAGVSSFGVGGTNVHMVLQSAADVVPHYGEKNPFPVDVATPVILPLSTHDANQLPVLCEKMAQYLEQTGIQNLSSVMHTLFKGRKHFAHRTAAYGESADQLVQALRNSKVTSRSTSPKIGMIFTGQGCQYSGMGKALFQYSTVFRNALLRIENALKNCLPHPLTDLLFAEEHAELLDHTSVTQPAIFAIQYALTEFWRSLGVIPAAVAGHSIGEFAAAVQAGVLSPEDAARLIAQRGALTGALPHGSGMMAVIADEDDVLEKLSEFPEYAVDIAAYNGGHTVLSGITSDLQQLKVLLEESGMLCKMLSVSHAFHSRILEPMLGAFQTAANSVPFAIPSLPFISSVTGKKEQAALATAEYWTNHLRKPVQFVQAMQGICAEGCDVILEVGPTPILIGMAKKFMESSAEYNIQWIPSMTRSCTTVQPTFEAAATLYQNGVSIQHQELLTNPVQSVPLPTYPFKRERHWQPRSVTDSIDTVLHLARKGKTAFNIVQVPHPTKTFEAQISLTTFPTLEHHRINGELVAPLGLLTELLTQVWKELAGTSNAISITYVELHAPVLLDAASDNPVYVLQQTDGTLLVQQQQQDTWITCLSAAVETQRSADVIEVMASDAEKFTRDDLPQSLQSFGLDNNGHALWQFTNARMDGKHLEATISLSPTLLDSVPSRNGRSEFMVHPSLIDPCIQLLGGMSDLFTDEHGTAYLLLPATVGAVTAHGSHGNKVQCHIQVRDKNARGASCDIQLHTPEGNPVVELHDIQFVKVPAVKGTCNQAIPHTLLRWEELSPKKLQHRNCLNQNEVSNDFLFVAASQNTVANLAVAKSISANQLNTVQPQKVLFYMGDSTQDEAVTAFAELANNAKLTDLVVVTNNALAVDKTEAPIPSQRAIWELARVFMAEHPAVSVRMLDIADNNELTDNIWNQLGNLTIPTQPAQQLYRNGQWFTSVLEEAISTDSVNLLAPITNTTTLVTGGTGGLGKKLIEQLSQHGHTIILVTARSQPTKDAAAFFDSLSKNGTQVTFASADIASKEEMEQVLARCGNDLPRLGAVYHLAGQTGSMQLRDLTPAAFCAASSAKTRGVDILDAYTRTNPVKRFVLFSSISTMHGIAGAGTYTASNGYLEAIAEQRQHDGFAATAICWGPFSDCGMLSEDTEGHKARKASGITALTSEALTNLTTVPSAATCIVADVQWDTFCNAIALTGSPVSFALQSAADNAEKSKASSRTSNDGINLHDLKGSLSDAIQTLLQMNEAPLSEDNLLMAGLDSLLFLQLAQQIKKALDVRITPTEVFANPTIDHLCTVINSKLDIVPTVQKDPTENKKIAEAAKPFPLTDTQYAYWAGRSDIMPMGNISCHSYAEYDIENLDRALYQEAWNALIERHQMLRMTITEKGEQQILPSPQKLQIMHEDLSGVPEQAQQLAITNVRNALSHKVHDTTSWPLFTVQTLKLADNVTRICMSIDLLLADARSLQILMRELRDIYTQSLSSSVHNAIAQLPKLDYSFQKYIIDAQKYAEQGDGAELLVTARDYWEKRLEHLPNAPELPVAVAPESIKTPVFSHRSCTIEKAVWDGLKTRAQAHGLTPSLLLLSVYADVLARWSHTKSFCLNITLFNRQPFHEQVQDIVGDFTTLSLLEVNNDPTLPFEYRAQAIRDQFWSDMAHTSFSGVEVIRQLTRKGKLSFGESYPVVFTSNISSGKPTGKLLETLGTRGYNISQTPQVWLDNQVHEDDGNLVIHWDAVDALFPDQLIDDMLSAYEYILRKLAVSDASWSQNSFACLPERTLAVLETMNDVTEPLKSYTLWSLFMQQYTNSPDAIALCTTDTTFTYKQLGDRAAGFAKQLAEQGATHGSLVGISLPKSAEQIAAVLATQALGAVFVPVDHEQPMARKQAIIQESKLSFVIAEDPIKGVTHIAPSGIVDAPERYTNPASEQDLAYIIFTSGSTGKPKGVSITHRAVVNTLFDINKRYAISSKDTVFGVSRLSFDLSVYDIFGAFAAGATLVLPDDSLQRDPEHWLDCITTHQCTVWNSAPALMQLAVEYAQASGTLFPTLRIAMLSGDKISPELPQQLRAIAHNVEVHSLGGATEASIWSICLPISNHTPELGPVPYGRPMINQQWHVLDSALEPCPEHVIGDLYIAGEGLAQGYYGRDDLTDQTFIIHPTTGDRLYKTGDMGALKPEGYLTIIGRKDYQVKIRGHRVEPSEVEHVLSQLKAISAIVVVPAVIQNNTVLVAYFSGEGDHQALIKHATDQLPRYMVPAYYVHMDTFPMTPSGKVDRKQLPQPDISMDKQPASDTQEALTQLQTIVADVWNTLLQQESTPLDMDFFNAGGDSVLAAQLVLGVRKALGVTLALPRLFEHPTIATLCQHIQETNPAIEAKLSDAAVDVKSTVDQNITSEATLDAEHINITAPQPDVTQPDESTTSIVDIVHVDVLKRHPVCNYVPSIVKGKQRSSPCAAHPFLTGATGFLGCHILASLLKTGATNVTCLVRAKNEPDGLKRILATAAQYDLSLDQVTDKITVVTGDLAQKCFGLSKTEFNLLADTIDSVFHAGALVHYIYSCESLLGPNVIGTREAIRLAATGIAKPLHHVSTVSVFSPLRTTDDLLILEDEQIEQDMKVFGGYPQSKWLAERLVFNAIEAGLDAHIYRPGLITGASTSGAWNKEDFLWRIMQGSLQADMIPNLKRVENFLPVDVVADALVHIAKNTCDANVYHLDGFTPVSSYQLVQELQKTSTALQIVSYATWRKAIAKPDNPLFPLLPLLPENVNPESISRQLRFDNSNARDALQDSEVTFPSLQKLLPIYLKRIVA